MGYINDVFARMDLLQIRAFLIEGVEDYLEYSTSYEDRLKTESDPIYKRLHNLYPNEDELDKATADLAQALATYESVYFEIGMKAGARLIYQLLMANDNSNSDSTCTAK